MPPSQQLQVSAPIKYRRVPPPLKIWFFDEQDKLSSEGIGVTPFPIRVERAPNQKPL